ncbi:hypothetical protein N431DRAFT_447233 [Stipitochalara longipes BDJ]|nr:hypothetical protein N431DRAFT_447233 [Stipitochalara longipes BDJ]
MVLIPIASKAPTFAEVVAGKREPSKEKECHLLKAPRGKDELPSTFDGETGAEIKHSILKHSDDFFEIVHQKAIAIRAFNSIAAMRTNKQMHEEIADMLYGGNTFIFDTRDNAAEPSPWTEKERREFEGLRHRIPGLEDQEGRLPPKQQIARSLERIFEPKSYMPQYAWKILFCDSVTRLIKIEGHLHTCLRYPTDRRLGGLGRVRQVYTPVLREICKNLRSLTLHLGYDDECINMTKTVTYLGSIPLAEDDDVRGDEGKSDEEKIDGIVGRIVRELKRLKHLQLGDYKKAVIQIDDVKWGKSARWMDIVRQRSEGVNVEREYADLDGAVTK